MNKIEVLEVHSINNDKVNNSNINHEISENSNNNHDGMLIVAEVVTLVIIGRQERKIMN